MGIIHLVLAFLKVFFASRAVLAAENAMLRQQLIVLQRSVKRPKFRKQDRICLSWLSKLWSGWRSALLIVQPATVIRWHRQGFKNSTGVGSPARSQVGRRLTARSVT